MTIATGIKNVLCCDHCGTFFCVATRGTIYDRNPSGKRFYSGMVQPQIVTKHGSYSEAAHSSTRHEVLDMPFCPALPGWVGQKSSWPKVAPKQCILVKNPNIYWRVWRWGGPFLVDPGLPPGEGGGGSRAKHQSVTPKQVTPRRVG